MDKQHIVDEINVKVYKNGEGKIKGEVLNSVLIDIISFIEDRVTALKEDLVFITEEEYEALVNSGTTDSFAQGSSRLTKVILPDTITYIGWGAFSGCISLRTFIVLASTPPSLQSDTFNSTNSTFFIYVPDASVDAYKKATNWSQYQSRIKPLSEYVE